MIISPHSAALTKECTLRVAMVAVKGIADSIKGKIPEYVYNKEVLNN